MLAKAWALAQVLLVGCKSPVSSNTRWLISAAAAKGIANHMGENILYIDVMYNLSVDCDCMSNPSPPTMADIGILASLDPVALGQACVDMIYAAPDGGDVIQRIESRNGVHILEHAEAIGLGNRQYELVQID